MSHLIEQNDTNWNIKINIIAISVFFPVAVAVAKLISDGEIEKTKKKKNHMGNMISIDGICLPFSLNEKGKSPTCHDSSCFGFILPKYTAYFT